MIGKYHLRCVRIGAFLGIAIVITAQVIAIALAMAWKVVGT